MAEAVSCSKLPMLSEHGLCRLSMLEGRSGDEVLIKQYSGGLHIRNAEVEVGFTIFARIDKNYGPLTYRPLTRNQKLQVL